MVIFYAYMPFKFIPNKITLTKYYLTRLISKFKSPGSFEIHCKAVHGKFHGSRGQSKHNCLQEPANFTGLAHGKLSWFLTLHDKQDWF